MVLAGALEQFRLLQFCGVVDVVCVVRFGAHKKLIFMFGRCNTAPKSIVCAVLGS